MTNPIFGRPRHWYDSYTDFWSLVDLCGYRWCYIDEMEIENPDALYIFTGPEAKHEFRDARARIIYWLLEWYADYQQRDGVAETWVCNRTFADRVGARYVPMGGHPQLGTPERGDGRFHVAHMSYDGIHRRSLILGRIKEYAIKMGEWKFQFTPNAWGDIRAANLRNSRMMVHLHQNEDFPAIAPLRAVLAAAYALPMVSENGWSLDPYTEYITGVAERDLPQMVWATLETSTLEDKGHAFYEYVCNELRFDKVVEANI